MNGPARPSTNVEQTPNPPTAGPMVRTLARFSSGMRQTADQIPAHYLFWKGRNATVAPDEPTWVVLGDSLGQGIGASHPERGYVGQLEVRLLDTPGYSDLRAAEGEEPSTPGERRLPILNLSESGARVADVLSNQIPRLMSVTDPALVTVTVGNNDLLKTFTDRGLLRGFDELLGQLPNTAVVATLPDLGSLRAQGLNRKLRKRFEAAGLRTADVGSHLTSWRDRQATDRFHPNDLGYSTWADAFAEALR